MTRLVRSEATRRHDVGLDLLRGAAEDRAKRVAIEALTAFAADVWARPPVRSEEESYHVTDARAEGLGLYGRVADVVAP